MKRWPWLKGWGFFFRCFSDCFFWCWNRERIFYTTPIFFIMYYLVMRKPLLTLSYIRSTIKKLLKLDTYVYVIIIFLLLIIVSAFRSYENGVIVVGKNIIVIKDYDREIKMSEQARNDLLDIIKTYSDKISTFVPRTGTTASTGSNLRLDNSKPNEAWFIAKANAYQTLGQNNTTIKTLYQALRYYPKSRRSWENLGLLYESVGEYHYAIHMYKKVIKNYPELKQRFSNQIYGLYMKLHDKENAKKYYSDSIKGWIWNSPLLESISGVE